jgi:hypothetical protein
MEYALENHSKKPRRNLAITLKKPRRNLVIMQRKIGPKSFRINGLAESRGRGGSIGVEAGIPKIGQYSMHFLCVLENCFAFSSFFYIFYIYNEYKHKLHK